MVKVSVLMPVFNTDENYLREAIESILNQTFSDFEFLICNDGSDNNAEAVIKSYNDKRIRYIKNPKNIGLIKTLNKGLSFAKGEYIARMDSDDVSMPHRLETQIKYMDKHIDIGICGSAVEVFPENKMIVFSSNPKLLDLLFGSVFAHPTVVLRTSDFKKYNLGYDTDFPHAEDFALWAQALQKIKAFNFEEPLLKYRWHGNNISAVKAEEQSVNTKLLKRKLLQKFLSSDENIEKLVSCTSTHKIRKKFCGMPWLKIVYHDKIKIYLFGLLVAQLQRK